MRLGDLGGPLERATQIVIKALKYRDFTEEIGSALDGNRTCNLRFRRQNADKAETLETKHDEHFTKSQGHLEGHQNFSDERFNELSKAWSTLPKSTQLGIIALFDIAKANSLDRGIIGIVGIVAQNPRAGTESPCPARARK